jgi:hypothetical protein
MFAARPIEAGSEILQYARAPAGSDGFPNFGNLSKARNAEFVRRGAGMCSLVASRRIQKHEQIIATKPEPTLFGARTKMARFSSSLTSVHRLSFDSFRRATTGRAESESDEHVAPEPPNTWVRVADEDDRPGSIFVRNTLVPSLATRKVHQESMRLVSYIAVADGVAHKGTLHKSTEDGRLYVVSSADQRRIFVSRAACYETSCFYAKMHDKKLVVCRIVSVDAMDGIATTREVVSPFVVARLDPLDLLKLAIADKWCLDGDDDDVASYVVDQSYRSNLLPTNVSVADSREWCLFAKADAGGVVAFSQAGYPNVSDLEDNDASERAKAADLKVAEKEEAHRRAGEDTDDEAVSPNMCAVCKEKRSTHAFPCGHMCVCDVCSKQIAVANRKCPVCRQKGASRKIMMSFGFGGSS